MGNTPTNDALASAWLNYLADTGRGEVSVRPLGEVVLLEPETIPGSAGLLYRLHGDGDLGQKPILFHAPARSVIGMLRRCLAQLAPTAQDETLAEVRELRELLAGLVESGSIRAEDEANERSGAD